MPFVSVLKWPPPPNQSVLVRAAGSLIFAAHDGRGKWAHLWGGHRQGDLAEPPEAWFCARALKGMVEEPAVAGRPVQSPAPIVRGQRVFAFDDGEKLSGMRAR